MTKWFVKGDLKLGFFQMLVQELKGLMIMKAISRENLIKYLLVSLPILFLGGIGVYIATSSKTASLSQANTIPSECPSKPAGSLDQKAAKFITLTAEKLKQSGLLSAGKDIGYIFEGKAKQSFNFSTANEICIWVYSPANELLTGSALPVSGRYIVQVGILKGSANFDLEMSLEESTGSFTEQDAVNLVDQWLAAKAKIYAPPYATQLVASLTTGAVYEELMEPGGSIDWLRQNKAYYTYGSHKATSVGGFLSNDNMAQVDILVQQELSYYENGRLSRNEKVSEVYQFSFRLENGAWKISDRQKK
jgi:hypothetical protein